MLRNNALFLKKAAEEYSSGAHGHCGRINTQCSHLKTHFKHKFRPNYDKKCFIF